MKKILVTGGEGRFSKVLKKQKKVNLILFLETNKKNNLIF